nr:MAG TPA: head to tail adaptor [Caudoviricetes sp.]
MYLEPEELHSSMYAHIIDEITEGDEQIVLQAIEAAIEEVRSYLRPRYDADKIFAAEGKDRNALILEDTKVVTVWNIIKLSNVETIYEIWKERYDRVIKYLEGVAEGTRTPSLPLLTDEKGEVKIKSRFGSNPKFTHSL